VVRMNDLGRGFAGPHEPEPVVLAVGDGRVVAPVADSARGEEDAVELHLICTPAPGMGIRDSVLRTGFQTTIGPREPRKSRGPPSPCATAARSPAAASATIGSLVVMVRAARSVTSGS